MWKRLVMMNAMVWSHTMGIHSISESRVFSFVVNGVGERSHVLSLSLRRVDALRIQQKRIMLR